MQAVTFALALMEWLPAIQRGVTSAYEMMQWGRERLETMKAEGRDPTPEEWDELNQRTEALRTELHTD